MDTDIFRCIGVDYGVHLEEGVLRMKALPGFPGKMIFSATYREPGILETQRRVRVVVYARGMHGWQYRAVHILFIFFVQ